jgi:alpha-beta hydrolase superfamily lysophospholipase
VFLVGASFGGVAVMTYGSALPISGVVSLSGETHITGARLNALAAVPRLHVPLLIVGSRHDRNLSVPDALRLLRAAGYESAVLGSRRIRLFGPVNYVRGVRPL